MLKLKIDASFFLGWEWDYDMYPHLCAIKDINDFKYILKIVYKINQIFKDEEYEYYKFMCQSIFKLCIK